MPIRWQGSVQGDNKRAQRTAAASAHLRFSRPSRLIYGDRKNLHSAYMDCNQPGIQGVNAATRFILLACPEGIEPPTHSLEGCCSIQLSYGQTAACCRPGEP